MPVDTPSDHASAEEVHESSPPTGSHKQVTRGRFQDTQLHHQPQELPPAAFDQDSLDHIEDQDSLSLGASHEPAASHHEAETVAQQAAVSVLGRFEPPSKSDHRTLDSWLQAFATTIVGHLNRLHHRYEIGRVQPSEYLFRIAGEEIRYQAMLYVECRVDGLERYLGMPNRVLSVTIFGEPLTWSEQLTQRTWLIQEALERRHGVLNQAGSGANTLGVSIAACENLETKEAATALSESTTSRGNDSDGDVGLGYRVPTFGDTPWEFASQSAIAKPEPIHTQCAPGVPFQRRNVGATSVPSHANVYGTAPMVAPQCVDHQHTLPLTTRTPENQSCGGGNQRSMSQRLPGLAQVQDGTWHFNTTLPASTPTTFVNQGRTNRMIPPSLRQAPPPRFELVPNPSMVAQAQFSHAPRNMTNDPFVQQSRMPVHQTYSASPGTGFPMPQILPSGVWQQHLRQFVPNPLRYNQSASEVPPTNRNLAFATPPQYPRPGNGYSMSGPSRMPALDNRAVLAGISRTPFPTPQHAASGVMQNIHGFAGGSAVDGRNLLPNMQTSLLSSAQAQPASSLGPNVQRVPRMHPMDGRDAFTTQQGADTSSTLQHQSVVGINRNAQYDMAGGQFSIPQGSSSLSTAQHLRGVASVNNPNALNSITGGTTLTPQGQSPETRAPYSEWRPVQFNTFVPVSEPGRRTTDTSLKQPTPTPVAHGGSRRKYNKRPPPDTPPPSRKRGRLSETSESGLSTGHYPMPGKASTLTVPKNKDGDPFHHHDNSKLPATGPALSYDAIRALPWNARRQHVPPPPSLRLGEVRCPLCGTATRRGRAADSHYTRCVMFDRTSPKSRDLWIQINGDVPEDATEWKTKFWDIRSPDA
ncbi:hypothetical protein BDY21DRAFT_78746 [Lineolata rhizophorae]|uniref:Uncharacterized protein n=1 Tax=Lineolata rhizophorae TaxID=578093 RepID=A0A6A6NTM2_9PEZI|nr:hypothetical protein BDY21DRAFT_78746 [Lineolata rhizophorae]